METPEAVFRYVCDGDELVWDRRTFTGDLTDYLKSRNVTLLSRAYEGGKDREEMAADVAGYVWGMAERVRQHREGDRHGAQAQFDNAQGAD